jgi:hypothetical protein
MGLNYCASSPVLTLPPQQPQSTYFMQRRHHDAIGDPNYAIAPNQSPPKKFAPKHPKPPSMNYLAQSSNGVAGRKRSRDEHDDGIELNAGAVQPHTPKAEPVMGPGMTLIYPDEPALNIPPESQSGTWMEEKAEASPSPTEVPVTRPRIIARKSQRCSVDEFITDSTSGETDPIVLRLGIGWKRIPESQASGIAGSEAYIRNQYPYVKQPKILLRHEGLGLLVARSDAIDQRGLIHQWWLFPEHLNQCRLLCNSDEEEVFRRLANKKQDERGNWVPDILADGQIIYAKDAAKSSMIPTTTTEEVMEIDR